MKNQPDICYEKHKSSPRVIRAVMSINGDVLGRTRWMNVEPSDTVNLSFRDEALLSIKGHEMIEQAVDVIEWQVAKTLSFARRKE